MRTLLQERAGQPRKRDVISAILDARIGDEPADFESQVGMVTLIIFGGLETTTNVLTSALHHFARHPDDLARLRDHPELTPGAIEEFLRIYAPTVFLNRTLTRDVELRGYQMRRGERVSVSYAAANRDPEEFPNPAIWDPARSPNRHLAFGAGRHRCLGSHMVRLEFAVAFDQIRERLGAFEVAKSDPARHCEPGPRGAHSLRLVLCPDR